MGTVRFQIEKYQVTLGADLLSIQTNMDAKIVAIIGCYGGEYQLMINFVDYDKIPDAHYDESKKLGVLFIPVTMLDTYIDLLRNEKPLFAYCNSEHPQWSNISTEQEDVGENERRSIF
ncbi:MAG: hypothetical protein JW915_09050 [Chitinispirillaceae bacterium]|nr:hypothetical protein [Chitinispirillaceae bacterium]